MHPVNGFISEKKGIYFLQKSYGKPILSTLDKCNDIFNGQWRFISYQKLFLKASNIASQLSGFSHSHNRIVFLVGNNSPLMVMNFIAALMADFIPVIFSAPMTMENPDVFIDKISAAKNILKPDMILSDTVLIDELSRIDQYNHVYPMNEGELIKQNTVCLPSEYAYLQLTSGSTGGIKAVKVDSITLQNNLIAISQWLHWQPQHKTVCWLPLNHDMGLVGCLFASIYQQTDLYLLTPEQFIRKPVDYLNCFTQGQANLSAMPPFGLEHICKRIKPDQISGMDFSSCHALVVGAQPVTPKILNEFEGLLLPAGLKPTCLCPSYGMAENTLAASGSTPNQRWHFQQHSEQGVIHDVVSSGYVLNGNNISIVDETGTEAEEGQPGEIVIQSNSCTAYFSNKVSQSSWFLNKSTIVTGDYGWIKDRQLYVVGRIGDALKIRGSWVFPEVIENLICTLFPELIGKVTVLLGSHQSKDFIVCLLKQNASRFQQDIEDLIIKKFHDVNHDVIAVPANMIERTTSGKPKRRKMWFSYVNGDFNQCVTALTA